MPTWSEIAIVEGEKGCRYRMSSSGTISEVAPWRRRLYLPAYRVSDAGRYSGVSARTVSYWHFGGSKAGAVLPGRTPRQDLSYLELVEVAFVATFRGLGVSLQRIRRARDYASQVLKSEYPFAEYSWLTEGHRVLLDLRSIEGDASLGRLVAADIQGQLAWKGVVSDRFHQFDYDNGIALVWHLASRRSPVVIDPRISFGAPSVRGVPTWALKGRWDAGESVAEIQTDFGLGADEVRDGLQFEGVDLDDIQQVA